MKKEILYAENISKFKFFTENRPLNNNKLHKIKKSIIKHGFIGNVICIKWNHNIYIVDGQHRAAIMDLMGLEIPYEIVSVSNKREAIELMTDLNSTGTSWTSMDYVHAWSVFGLEDYKILEHYIKKFGFGVGEIASITSGYTTKDVNKIKNGTFKVLLSEVEINKICNYVEECILLIKSLDKRQRNKFVRSFVKYYRFTPNYNHTLVIKKITEHIDCIRFFVEDTSFFEFFESIKD